MGRFVLIQIMKTNHLAVEVKRNSEWEKIKKTVLKAQKKFPEMIFSISPVIDF